MKKILWGFALFALALQSCKSDNGDEPMNPYIIASSLEEQNAWDDMCITKFLDEHYFDDKGNIVAFSESDTLDDNQKKLSAYDVQKLPSGVIYIKREDAHQPNPGTTIGEKDKISIMHNTITYIAGKNATTGNIEFTAASTFFNTIGGTGVPVEDPSYYYVKSSVIKKQNETYNTSYDRSYYEIEGLREGLSYFKAFNLEQDAPYNLQGVIIVPSRAAFARDPHYPYLLSNWTDRTFIFNFQIYKSTPRQFPEED